MSHNVSVKTRDVRGIALGLNSGTVNYVDRVEHLSLAGSVINFVDSVGPLVSCDSADEQKPDTEHLDAELARLSSICDELQAASKKAHVAANPHERLITETATECMNIRTELEDACNEPDGASKLPKLATRLARVKQSVMAELLAALNDRSSDMATKLDDQATRQRLSSQAHSQGIRDARDDVLNAITAFQTGQADNLEEIRKLVENLVQTSQTTSKKTALLDRLAFESVYSRQNSINDTETLDHAYGWLFNDGRDEFLASVFAYSSRSGMLTIDQEHEGETVEETGEETGEETRGRLDRRPTVLQPRSKALKFYDGEVTEEQQQQQQSPSTSTASDATRSSRSASPKIIYEWLSLPPHYQYLSMSTQSRRENGKEKHEDKEAIDQVETGVDTRGASDEVASSGKGEAAESEASQSQTTSPGLTRITTSYFDRLHSPSPRRSFEMTQLREPVRLFEWFSSSHETVFWITGKPGSGKSVLMNWILQNPYAQALLRERCEHRQLIVISFFFWISGAPLERSREGFLRSALMQIVQQDPRAIDALGDQFLAKVPSNTAVGWKWSCKELEDAIFGLIQAQADSTSYYFFLDGLDECDNKLADLLRNIKSLAKWPNVKVCVTSRDWDEIDAAIGDISYQKLAIHNYTRPDMMQFIVGKLQDNAQIARLYVPHSPGSPQWIKRQGLGQVTHLLCDRAEGVFLWVSLIVEEIERVIHSLLTWQELYDTLSNFPNSLEGYYRRMIANIPVALRASSAKLLLKHTLALKISDKLRRKPDATYLSVGYFLGDEASAPLFDRADDPFIQDEDHLTFHKALHFIQRSSKDIFKIKMVPADADESQIRGEFYAACTSRIENYVVFVHRSSFDFLQQDEVRATLLAYAGKGYLPEHDLSVGLLAALRLLERRALHGAMDYLYAINRHLRQIGLEKEADAILDMIPDRDAAMSHAARTYVAPYFISRAQMTKGQVEPYICGRSVLGLIFDIDPFNENCSDYWHQDRLTLVTHLLEHGCSPSDPDDLTMASCTAWEKCCRWLAEVVPNTCLGHAESMLFDVALAFIKHGALMDDVFRKNTPEKYLVRYVMEDAFDSEDVERLEAAEQARRNLEEAGRLFDTQARLLGW